MMVVQLPTWAAKGPKFEYRIYDTKEAKQNYKNGVIEQCCGNTRCSAHGLKWLFCGETIWSIL